MKKSSYMRFDPEGITQNPEIPFAKSMPDYIMRWLASRFIDDLDELEDLGILTPEVRARKEAELAAAETGNGTAATVIPTVTPTAGKARPRQPRPSPCRRRPRSPTPRR